MPGYLAIQNRIKEGVITAKVPLVYTPYDDARKTVIFTNKCIIDDDFADNLDEGWGRQIGAANWLCASAAYKYNAITADDALSYITNMIPVANCDIYVNIQCYTWGTGTTGHRAGVAFRIQDTGSFYFVGFDPRNNYFRIAKKVAGVWSTLVSLSYTSFPPDWIYIRNQGTSIKVWINTLQINDTPNMSYTDSSFSSGKIGVACNKVNFDTKFIKVWQL